MICNKNGTPGHVSIPIAAGQTIRMQWDNWPVTHHGPMTSYLANCKGPCETVNKMTLEFFKIDQVGLVNTTKVVRDGEGSAAPYLYSGTWGSDIMIGDGYTWDIVIPPDIESGNYVLRHETIALHQVTIPGLNAQVYPSCWNLIIKGNGTANPSGISATKFYTANEPAMRFDIYNGTIAENPQLPPYPLPGPPMYKGAVEAIQTPPAAPTAEATGIRSSK
jgi:cellulase